MFEQTAGFLNKTSTKNRTSSNTPRKVTKLIYNPEQPKNYGTPQKLQVCKQESTSQLHFQTAVYN